MPYSVNRAAKPHMNYVGIEKTPVFVLDNFLEDIEGTILQELEQLNFNAAPTYYPGIRSKLPNQYIVSISQALIPLLHQIYAIPPGYTVEFFDSYYSLVTCAPEELSVEQRIPHFDGTDEYRFALLHYLNPNSHGGTAFFRHTPTNIERISESKAEQFLSSVSQHFTHYGEPKDQYIDDSNQQFTKIGEVPYLQNRMVIYPGNLLHSGMINPNIDIDASPFSGRLTANVFLRFVKK